MPNKETSWPDWWQWPLDCDNPHLLKRMRDRGFDEVALREMLEAATGWRPDHVSGRFVIECRYNGRGWEVIVEPDEATKTLIVVTAYPVD